MAKYSNTKAKINEKISTNGRQAVTGSILNDVLQTMVDSLGADYQFGGLVQPGSSFTAGEQPVVFLATTPGTYTNFGGIVVADGEVALLVWSGSAWSKQTTDIATRTEVSQLGQQVIYDVTANNDGATFASLSALLSSENLSTLIPIAVRCGGMSIRFVRSSDNKYVQYRLKSSSWSNNINNWECFDDLKQAIDFDRKQYGLIAQGVIGGKIAILNTDFKVGDIIAYKFVVPANTIGYLVLKNSSDTAIKYIGATSTSTSERTFEDIIYADGTFTYIQATTGLNTDFIRTNNFFEEISTFAKIPSLLSKYKSEFAYYVFDANSNKYIKSSYLTRLSLIKPIILPFNAYLTFSNSDQINNCTVRFWSSIADVNTGNAPVGSQTIGVTGQRHYCIPKGSICTFELYKYPDSNLVLDDIDSVIVSPFATNDDYCMEIIKDFTEIYISDESFLECIFDSNGNALIRPYGSYSRSLNVISPGFGNHTSKSLIFSWSDIKSAVGADYVITIDNEEYIKIPVDWAFGINIENGTLVLHNRTYMANRQQVIPILISTGGQLVGGKLLAKTLVSNERLTTNKQFQLIYNSLPYVSTLQWNEKAHDFGKLFYGAEIDKIDTFCFFTDPHLMGIPEPTEQQYGRFGEYINSLEKVCNSVSIDNVICGGDWLNNSSTRDQACYLLGLIDGVMRSKFGERSKLMVGNHDTNEQGKADSESEMYTGVLPVETVESIWYRNADTKKAYYSFDANVAKCYVLNSWTEYAAQTMGGDLYEQLKWLCAKLIEDNPAHCHIFSHIIMQVNQSETYMTDLGLELGYIISAFNNHSTITVDDEEFDFSNTTGHIDFVMSGHTHADSIGTIGDVPLIITRNFTTGGIEPTFDLVFVNYKTSKVNLVRIGQGADREVSI